MGIYFDLKIIHVMVLLIIRSAFDLTFAIVVRLCLSVCHCNHWTETVVRFICLYWCCCCCKWLLLRAHFSFLFDLCIVCCEPLDLKLSHFRCQPLNEHTKNPKHTQIQAKSSKCLFQFYQIIVVSCSLFLIVTKTYILIWNWWLF